MYEWFYDNRSGLLARSSSFDSPPVSSRATGFDIEGAGAVIKLWRKTNNSVSTITKTVIPTTTSESNRRKKTTDSKRKRSSGIGVVLEEVGSSHPNENFSHSGEATTTTTTSSITKIVIFFSFPSTDRYGKSSS
jgi:hypothetical protein